MNIMSDIFEYDDTCNILQLVDWLVARFQISPEMGHIDMAMLLQLEEQQWMSEKRQLYDMLNGSIPIDTICWGDAHPC